MKPEPRLAPELRIVAGRDELAREAADVVAASAEAALAARGAFRLVLSGGSTPRDLYRRLADLREPWRGRIDWRRTHLFWGDERPVPPDHAESNFRMASEALLAQVPIPAANVHRIPAELAPDAAAQSYETHLRRTFALAAEGPVPAPPASSWFDLALLGLGADAHTASLFPGSPALAATSRLCLAPWVPAQASFRITLTPAAFAGTARALFLVAGADKAAALAATLSGDESSARCPALAIRPRDGRPLWLVDREAAARVRTP